MFMLLPIADSFWETLATNVDDNGVEFVSLMEAKIAPVWGSQFHPEKNAFEWTNKYKVKIHRCFLETLRHFHHLYSSVSYVDAMLMV